MPSGVFVACLAAAFVCCVSAEVTSRSLLHRLARRWGSNSPLGGSPSSRQPSNHHSFHGTSGVWAPPVGSRHPSDNNNPYSDSIGAPEPFANDHRYNTLGQNFWSTHFGTQHPSHRGPASNTPDGYYGESTMDGHTLHDGDPAFEGERPVGTIDVPPRDDQLEIPRINEEPDSSFHANTYQHTTHNSGVLEVLGTIQDHMWYTHNALDAVSPLHQHHDPGHQDFHWDTHHGRTHNPAFSGHNINKPQSETDEGNSQTENVNIVGDNENNIAINTNSGYNVGLDSNADLDANNTDSNDPADEGIFDNDNGNNMVNTDATNWVYDFGNYQNTNGFYDYYDNPNAFDNYGNVPNDAGHTEWQNYYPHQYDANTDDAYQGFNTVHSNAGIEHEMWGDGNLYGAIQSNGGLNHISSSDIRPVTNSGMNHGDSSNKYTDNSHGDIGYQSQPNHYQGTHVDNNNNYADNFHGGIDNAGTHSDYQDTHGDTDNNNAYDFHGDIHNPAQPNYYQDTLHNSDKAYGGLYDYYDMDIHHPSYYDYFYDPYYTPDGAMGEGILSPNTGNSYEPQADINIPPGGQSASDVGNVQSEAQDIRLRPDDNNGRPNTGMHSAGSSVWLPHDSSHNTNPYADSLGAPEISYATHTHNDGHRASSPLSQAVHNTAHTVPSPADTLHGIANNGWNQGAHAVGGGGGGYSGDYHSHPHSGSNPSGSSSSYDHGFSHDYGHNPPAAGGGNVYYQEGGNVHHQDQQHTHGYGGSGGGYKQGGTQYTHGHEPTVAHGHSFDQTGGHAQHGHGYDVSGYSHEGQHDHRYDGGTGYSPVSNHDHSHDAATPYNPHSPHNTGSTMVYNAASHGAPTSGYSQNTVGYPYSNSHIHDAPSAGGGYTHGAASNSGHNHHNAHSYTPANTHTDNAYSHAHATPQAGNNHGAHIDYAPDGPHPHNSPNIIHTSDPDYREDPDAQDSDTHGASHRQYYPHDGTPHSYSFNGHDMPHSHSGQHSNGYPYGHDHHMQYPYGGNSNSPHHSHNGMNMYDDYMYGGYHSPHYYGSQYPYGNSYPYGGQMEHYPPMGHYHGSSPYYYTPHNHASQHNPSMSSSEVDNAISNLHSWPHMGSFSPQALSCVHPGELSNGFLYINYRTPQTIEYDCEYPYTLAGNVIITCDETTKLWDGPPPKCTIQTMCNDPPIIANGYATTEHDRIMGYDIAVYSCQNSYRLVGKPDITCTPNGRWTGALPVCEEWPCTEPNIENAKHFRIFETADGKLVVEIECMALHSMVGTNTITCDPETGEWSTEWPVCKLRADLTSSPNVVSACDKPMNIPNGQVELMNGYMAEYTCNWGYRREGPALVYCNDYGHWVGALPKCTSWPCPYPGPIVNGNFWIHQIDEIRLEYFCNPEYIMKGTDMIMCDDVSGMWSGEPPACLRQDAEEFRCETPLQIDNGNVVDEGTVAVYSCVPGHYLVGDYQIFCNNGDWSGQTPKCNPWPCAYPGPITNGNFWINWTPQLSLSYFCTWPNHIHGDTTLSCDYSSGKWSSSPPTCVSQRSCADPTTIDNGQVELIGSYVAEYTCDTWNKMEGDSIVTCNEDGTWSSEAPLCISLPCERPPTIDNGNHFLEEEDPQLQVKYYCYRDFILSGAELTKCDADTGQWDEEPPQCLTSAPGCEGDPPAIENGSFESISSRQVEYECDRWYSLQGFSVLTCDNTGEWPEAPTCAPLPCDHPGGIMNGNFWVHQVQGTSSLYLDYFCYEPYLLSGEKKLTCNSALRQWDHEAPTCMALQTCPDLAAIVNGQITRDGLHAEYVCNTGFVLQGESKITCTPAGEWSSEPPECLEQQKCEEPPALTNGEVQMFTDFTAKYSCNVGYRLAGNAYQSCSVQGTWDDLTVSCQAWCPMPGPLENGHYDQFDLPGEHLVYLRYFCDANHSLLGDQTIFCDTSTGKWTGNPPACLVNRLV